MAKKLINDPVNVVREALEGAVMSQPGTALLGDQLIVVRADRVVTADNRDQLPVALISGGGAGHEPAHAGYVADGMLTAAVSGEVFASPSVDAILDGIRAVTATAGSLLIVKSYTGDRLNFGLAAEIARSDGLAVEMVVVADDVAITESDANAGRRGLAGTVLAHKVAGAAAAAGRSLAEVAQLARLVTDGLGTIGVGLSGVTVPGADGPGFVLGPTEIEIGLGIHGEAGVARGPLRTADVLVDDLVRRIAEDRHLVAGARVVALVGSAGATPPIELQIVSRAVANAVNGLELELVRLWSGLVMTSLDMAGISVTLLALPQGAQGEDLLALLDAPTSARAWPGGVAEAPRLLVLPRPAAEHSARADAGKHDPQVAAAIEAACHALLTEEAELTRLDQVVGDGDLGSALARGARAWLADPVTGSAAGQLRGLADHARRVIGGTSGPLYAVGLLQTAEGLARGLDWPEAFRAGVQAVMDLGGAVPGDRTMIDALVPAIDGAQDGLDAALSAARAGAAATAALLARRGRSSYLGDRVRGTPDPGAVAVTVWLAAVRDSVAG